MSDPRYSHTARALAARVDEDEDDTNSPAPHPHRPSHSWERRSSILSHDRRARWIQKVESLQRQGLRLWYSLTPLQRAGLVILHIVFFIMVILSLVYGHRMFAWLAPLAKKWRELRGGWLIMWAMTFCVSFPPLIGYSSLLTISGFVFGMKGWFIMSTATVVGSTCSFLASRTVLKPYVSKLTEKNNQFDALSLVLKHDGLKLLVMIRLCPLPFSLSNGAISTIPTVTWQKFALATALATPKLLVHVFIGGRLGDIAENGDKMDLKTKMISYASIVLGSLAGIATGYFIYTRTKARAKQLEAEESVEETTVDEMGRGDDVSLHTTYNDDLESGFGYRDDFTDDEDAREHDVFDEGDGETEDEGASKHLGR
ncbi:hypothetical protein M433DRAFT_140549 [Acidomyces richmondensis BFW]|nr:MAG: hypothetical protein FE78DRAFT_74355 [Acidomyces sp. 'richmondensis']KYG48941.1 hypothetical protein M433DRAFT_140549 [Acidomyces richmondensis BFW]